MSRKLLQTEKSMSREEASEKLHELADKVAEGRVELSSGQDTVELTPADNLEFELEVEEEQDGDVSIEVELEWSDETSDSDLEIS